ncbi:EAL domain-containing protein [Leptolyngbya sp. 15MV]|nr:EAL domain-containing protein [Leptolyngbya sp. 15MV]
MAPARTSAERADGVSADGDSPPEPLALAPGAGPGDDRRSGQRRVGGQARAKGSGLTARKHRGAFVLPRSIPWMAVAVLVAFLAAGLVSLRMPTDVALACAGGATAIALLAQMLALWERSEPRGRATALLAGGLTVAGIAGLGGIGFGHWMYLGGLDVRIGLAALVTLNAILATLLGPRIGLLFASKIACWAPVVVFDGTFAAFAALCLATAGAAGIARHQARIIRQQAENEGARTRERERAQGILSDYEETGQGWFWETDRRGNLTYVSPSVARTLGRGQGELDGKPFTSLFELAEDNRRGERTLTFHLSARSSFQELAVRAAVMGEARWWSINGRPVHDDFQNFCGFRGSGTDLTEKKRSQENANRLAQYDSLTGLANRLQMSQTLDKILNSPRMRDRECSVLLLDLDRFKNVNDTLGHPAGDALLRQVAQRLERAVGQAGRCGRLGGDEFEVIVPGRSEPERLAALAKDIIHSLSQPYSVEGQRVVIGVSVGIATAPDHGLTSETLIRSADLALYAAKDSGRGRWHFYSSDLHARAEERNRLEQDLRDAIANGELELFYQPVVHALSERISGFEALLRWHHPVHGWLSPEKFIPVAEDSGLIGAIGEWALRTACKDLARWPAEVRCAVNVSPLQFANPQFATVVAQALAQAGVDPARLELEITESVFLGDDHGTDAMFAALKRIGVRLALDDFGTGYSSLGYLKRAPFDKIKIDQSFVRGATQPGSRNGAIIASITSLAHTLGMDITAEGCETLDELDLVRRYGCTHVQGFVYSRPLSGAATLERLGQGLAIVASGPRSARAKRFTMLRKVVLRNGEQLYNGTIRNLSLTGAMVEGLWNVAPGTRFSVTLADSVMVGATSRWSIEDRTGVEFDEPLEAEQDGAIALIAQDGGPFVAMQVQARAHHG